MFPKGITHVETLVAVVEDPQSSLPDSARAILKLLVDTFTALEAQITTLDVEIKQRSKSDPTARSTRWNSAASSRDASRSRHDASYGI